MEAVEGAAYCWLAHKACSLQNQGPPVAGPAPPTRGCWALSLQSLTEKMSVLLACLFIVRSYGGIFSTEAPSSQTTLAVSS